MRDLYEIIYESDDKPGQFQHHACKNLYDILLWICSHAAYNYQHQKPNITFSRDVDTRGPMPGIRINALPDDENPSQSLVSTQIHLIKSCANAHCVDSIHYSNRSNVESMERNRSSEHIVIFEGGLSAKYVDNYATEYDRIKREYPDYDHLALFKRPEERLEDGEIKHTVQGVGYSTDELVVNYFQKRKALLTGSGDAEYVIFSNGLLTSGQKYISKDMENMLKRLEGFIASPSYPIDVFRPAVPTFDECFPDRDAEISAKIERIENQYAEERNRYNERFHSNSAKIM